MIYRCQMELIIRKVDNGYIVEWSNGKYTPETGENSGVKVFDTLDKAIKFARSLL